MTHRLLILAALVALTTHGLPVFASRTQSADLRESKGRDSELNSLIFDELAAEIGLGYPTVFIVSHLGKGERFTRLHVRRLHNARARWFHGESKWRSLVIVVAGERLSGPGTVEFYVSGTRRWVVTFGKGDDFWVDCCGTMPEYYPWFRGTPNVSL